MTEDFTGTSPASGSSAHLNLNAGQQAQQYSQNQNAFQPSFAQQQSQPSQGFQQPMQSQFQYPQSSQFGSNPDLQLISAKLDAIKAYLDTINQRLANLEQVARGDTGNRRW